ncbi:MAG TPA: ABC transporter permease [Ilumatobacter sp.]|nr:ABC transporter permease [Ilumatobacter sp.]
MTIADTSTEFDPPIRVGRPDTQLRRTWRRFKTQKFSMAAVAFLLLIIAVAIAAPWLAPHDPNAISARPLQGPDSEYWLGTDDIGRDLLSRAMYATRFSLGVSLMAVALSLVIGLSIGLLSGYFGGKLDLVLMRVIDAIMAFPGLLMAMAVVGILGPGVRNAMIGLSIAFSPTFARLVRGEVLALREESYVEAARVAGVNHLTMMRRHILPNMLPPIFVHTFLMMGIALVAEGALSFLGLSVQPPNSSLGSLLQRGFTVVNLTARLILVPGLVISVLSWLFNTTADGLNDAMGRKNLEVRK